MVHKSVPGCVGAREAARAVCTRNKGAKHGNIARGNGKVYGGRTCTRKERLQESGNERGNMLKHGQRNEIFCKHTHLPHVPFFL